MDDLSQSLLEDIKRGTQGDEQLLEQILSTSISLDEKNSRLEEALTIFPGLPKKTVKEALEASEWDIEVAIVSLINISEEQAQQARVAREEEKRQLYRKTEQMAMNRLQQYLSNEAKVKLQELLEENEGDIDETIVEFLAFINASKAEKEQEEQNQKICIINAVEESAPSNVSRAEIVTALEEANWDRFAAAKSILKISEERKISQLVAMCKHAGVNVTKERCESVLSDAAWDVSVAREILLRIPEEEDNVEEPHSPREDFLARSMAFDRKIAEHILEAPVPTVTDKLNCILRNDPAAIGLSRVPGTIPIPRVPEHKQPPPVESGLVESAAKLSLCEQSSPDVPEVSHVAEQNTDVSEVELTLSSELLDKSETLSVKWTFSQQSTLTPTSRDWIGLYKADQEDDGSYLTYQWVVPGTDTVEFSLKRFEYGAYNCRYHSANPKACLKVSPKFTIGPIFHLTPILEDHSDKNQVVLKIEQKSGDAPASGAWVGLYFIDFQSDLPRNQNYVSYQRLSSAKDNTLVFELPKTGVWEFRLFPLNTYESVGSTRIDVSGNDTISLRVETSLPIPQIFIDVNLQTKDIAADAPWIGVYKTCEANPRNYRRYKYLSVSGKSTVQFKAPIHAGAYEARLFSNNSYEVLAKSNPISLDGL